MTTRVTQNDNKGNSECQKVDRRKLRLKHGVRREFKTEVEKLSR